MAQEIQPEDNSRRIRNLKKLMKKLLLISEQETITQESIETVEVPKEIKKLIKRKRN